MSRKKPAKAKKKQANNKPDEVFTAGPLQVVRKGRLTQVAANWDPAAFDAMRASLPEKREELRKKIAENVALAVKLIEEYDPLPLLYNVFAKNCLTDPETYSEPEHEGVEARVEYAHSLATAVANHGSKEPDKEQHAQFELYVDNIIEACKWFFLVREMDPNSSRSIEETKFLGMMRHLFIRGSSHLELETQLIQALFTPHDEFLRTHGLFTTEELIAFCNDQLRHTESAIQKHLQFAHAVHESHQEFIALIEAEPDLELDEIKARIRGSEKGKKAIAAGDALEQRNRYFEFIVSVNDASRRLCDRLALVPGDNREFLTFKKSPGWPSNDSRIFTRPLIARDGQYYCPNPITLMRNRSAILESAIVDTDKRYYGNQFAKARGKLVERLALEHFRRLLPDARIYENLYYRTFEDGENRRFETDGVIVFDDRLFVLEMKSAPFSSASMRGADKSLKSELEHLVAEPYRQAIRTLRFVEKNSPARFEEENGTHALTLNGLKGFRGIYLVNITLSDIGHVAGRLNSAREMGLIGQHRWPWSVFVNDLRVISEILESPSEFLLYLERRLSLNDLSAVSTIDELDYLGMFLHDGLYFTPDDVSGLSRFTPLGYTVPIERYYDRLAGRVSTGDKPRLRVSDWYRELVGALEATGKPGAYHIGMTLLSLDGSEQERIENWFREYSALAESDFLPHTLTIAGKEFPSLIFCVTADSNPEHIRSREQYAEMKRFQLNVAMVIFIMLEGTSPKTAGFKILEGPFQNPAAMEVRLAEFRRTKCEQYIAQYGKPERNAPCPCNSGKKYKKCCFE